MTAAKDHADQLEAALEEYLTRLEAGESPDREELVSRFPDCAAQLLEVLDGLDFVDEKLAEERWPLQAAAPHIHPVPENKESVSGDGPAEEQELPGMRGYRLLEEIGGGSQGTVYKAEQIATKRIVALKVIREGAFASSAERIRFRDEIELASQLTHPGIVRVYDCGREEGRDYFAMEYIDGERLDTYLADRMLSNKTALRLFLEICDAVHYAHQHGVIHRDLKPSNILVDRDGHPHILDFGLAKRIADGSEPAERGVTQVGEFAGTWHYASPEQIKRDPSLVDVRSDVYTLGMILYEAITDAYPYPDESGSRDLLAKHILETPPLRPRAIRRDVDSDLDTIILRALDKNPERRYQSVADLVGDLRRYLGGFPIEAKRDSAWYLLCMLLRRHRWRVAAGVAVLLGIVVFAVTSSVLYARAETARATTEVRMKVVRESQVYLADKLDELNRTSNTLQQIAAAHPDLPQLQRFRRPVYEDARSLFDSIATDMPEGIFESVLSPDAEGRAEAIAWLDARQEDLSRVEDIAGTHRFVFGVERLNDSLLAAAEVPSAYWPAAQTCEALTAQALHRFRAGDHDSALRSLDAGRSIALDFASGRNTFLKATSLSARRRTYDVILAIFNSPDPVSAQIEPYVIWMISDPPLTGYRLAMMSERQKLAQMFEGASVGGGPGNAGSIDLDLLDELAGGMFSGLGLMDDEHRRLACQVSPQEVLQVIDRVITDIETWDNLTFFELSERVSNLRSTSECSSAWWLVKTLRPGVSTGFRNRARIEARRAAGLLAAHLCRYRLRTGQWPGSIQETVAADKRASALDPYIGKLFGYRLIDGMPILYSVNEDGQDNRGHHGAWEDEGTDVVFFAPHAPLSE